MSKAASQKRTLQILEEARKKLASEQQRAEASAPEPEPAAEPAAESEPEPEPWVAEPERFVSARDAVKLLFVEDSPPEKVGTAEAYSPPPEFVHQIFEREAIALPCALRPLCIEVLNSAASLHVLLRCNQPMSEAPVEDAMYRLAEVMPEHALCSSLTDFADKAAAPFCAESVGGPLLEAAPFSQSYERGGSTFEVRLGALTDSPERAAFSQRLQALMRWYIEGLSEVDHTDERWRLLTIWQRHTTTASGWRFVGGATLFHFNRWVPGSEEDGVKVPGGTRLLIRLCQALVLPGYQGQGHGSTLLRAAYAYALQQGAIELSVEDPSPKFRLMRDVVDLRACLERGLMKPPSTREPPSEALIPEARKLVLTTREQLTRCYEAQQWAKLQADGADEEMVKPFRLSVKRRLNSKHQEELGTLAAGEKRKARLEELYQLLMAEYGVLLSRVHI